MNEEFEDILYKLTLNFLNHVYENFGELQVMVDSNVDPLTLRNMAASVGVEMTPQEVKDAIEIIKIALDIVKENNEN